MIDLEDLGKHAHHVKQYADRFGCVPERHDRSESFEFAWKREDDWDEDDWDEFKRAAEKATKDAFHELQSHRPCPSCGHEPGRGDYHADNGFVLDLLFQCDQCGELWDLYEPAPEE